MDPWKCTCLSRTECNKTFKWRLFSPLWRELKCS